MVMGCGVRSRADLVLQELSPPFSLLRLVHGYTGQSSYLNSANGWASSWLYELARMIASIAGFSHQAKWLILDGQTCGAVLYQRREGVVST